MAFYTVPGMDELKEACTAFNAVQVAHLCAESGLRYLGPSGPVFLAGTVRIRGTFVDAEGGYWCDARLVSESAYNKTSAAEYYHDAVGGQLIDVALDLWVMDFNRGLYDAVIAPVQAVTGALNLPEPEPFPDGWCRDWTTLPHLTDESELALIAHGWNELRPEGEEPS